MNHTLVTAAAAALLLGSATAHSAELLTNGGFESQPFFGSGAAGNNSGFSGLVDGQLPGWTIAPGRAVTIHNTLLYPFITGNYSVNMDGEGFNGNNADFYQDVSTVNGQPYAFSFNHLGWFQTGVTATVSVVDLSNSAVLYSSTFGWTSTVVNESGSFTGTGGAVRVRVAENGSNGNDNTLIVDDFSLTGAVPEPSSAGLLAAGVCGIAIRRRRA